VETPDFVIHRVVAIKETSGDLYFKTKGDNNPFNDTELWGWIPEENIVGVVIFRIPYVGYPFIVFPLLFLRIVISFLTILLLISIVKDFVNRREKRETEIDGEENLS
ncbi:MAG: signal peptidase I, partial [Candidatus Korarchaeota archaeon]|nr:signal peptidase I [Candidatus Korarchaeota archaeon]NIU85055.1 signal peptidase I [Candidatus Thorarchaeota archaeon]NIW15195.1 signal peptidase I [Candidatus Thorarchaeota archaeon]NIW53107.1 signal peptidase I [Candidatus Korarchaeota archaeon]